MSWPSLQSTPRIALAFVVFAMALLLTPRALLDVAAPADSHEIPIDMLDSSDDCLWCSQMPEAPSSKNNDCDEERLYSPSDPDDHCLDSFRTREPSA